MTDDTQPPQEKTLEVEQQVATVISVEKSRFVARVGILLFLILLLAVFFFFATPRERLLRDHNLTKEKSENTTREIEYQEPFPQVTLTAKAAYVLDLTTGNALYAKNPDAQLPLASLTKLMTVLVASDIFKDQGLVTITKEALADNDHPSLLPSEHWLPRDLFTFTLMQSSNDGARAIASAAGSFLLSKDQLQSARDRFIALMNEKNTELGLTQTYFLNETGLDETLQTGGGYGSAHDVAVLLGELVRRHPEVLDGTRVPALALSTLDDKKHVAINTNTDLGNIPGLIGSKTGFTDLAGGNLVVAFDPGPGRAMIAAVLGSTAEERFHDIETLVAATLQYTGSAKPEPISL